ncbi:hypothetical protein [uncultured Sphaerochaeta sp.]|uniref:hypothetical protein n=1 Tax=uncultured Sphaerochaeta sp. TaxID=886478 RepID=UPI002A0A9E0B|nr:hypothetical protein [uncultured Sphaerochaeta sp.]
MQLIKLGNDKILVQDAEPFCMVSYSLNHNGNRVPCSDLLIQGNDRVSVSFGETGNIQDIFTFSSGFLTLRRTWNLDQGGSYRLHAAFSYPDENKENTLLIPSVWYRDNIQGKGCFPSSEKAPVWSFLETRMPIPCCEQLSNGKQFFTCATEKATEQCFLASVANERHGIIISIPGSEWPFSYEGKTILADTSDAALPTLQVETLPFCYERSFFIANQSAKDSLEAYRFFVEGFPLQSNQTKKTTLLWPQWYEYKLTRLLNLLQRSEKGYAFLIMGEGNGKIQEVYNYTAASFLVKSLEAAYELALCTKREANSSFLQKARKRVADLFALPDDSLLLATLAMKIGQFFLAGEIEDGVYQDCYDLKEQCWGGYLGIGEHDEFRHMVNSRCNGEVMKHYVLLFGELNTLGIRQPQFLNLAKRVARFYCDCQLLGGSFGRWWSKKGKPVDIKGTNGAYIASFFSALTPYLNPSEPLRNDILAALHQSYWYYGQMANEGNFYGDTLDADSCDKEAGVTLLSMFLDLYEMEQDKRLLESAQKAANFILLWIWQTDSYLPADSALGKQGFHTEGMTSVSVAHHHLDFYGMEIGYQFLRLAKETGDSFYKNQAIKMIRSCNQLVATKENGLGRDSSFLGWQPEQINHTRWDYFDRKAYQQGSFDIDVAWVTVLTLGSFLQIEKHFPTVLA